MAFSKEVENAADEYLKTLNIPPELEEGTTLLVKEMMSHNCYNNPK